MVATLPGITITWTESALADADFQYYNIKRKLTSESDYITIARLTDKSMEEFTDYSAKAGVTYDYAVTQVTPIGTESVNATTTDEVVPFTDVFLHDAFAARIGEDPTYCVFKRGPFSVSFDNEKDQEVILPFNSIRPIVLEGVALYRRVAVSYTWYYKSINGENEAAVQLARLQTLIEESQILCFRTGTGEVMFCMIEASGHGIQLPFTVPVNVNLIEVDWEENMDLVD